MLFAKLVTSGQMLRFICNTGRAMVVAKDGRYAKTL